MKRTHTRKNAIKAARGTPGAIAINPEAFYTTAALAGILGETPATIRERRHRGNGPRYSRPSGRQNAPAYYAGADVLSWLSRNSAASTAEESARADVAEAAR